MFVLNGIVYASEKRNDIEVISVKPLDDMMMILTFSTGEQRLFDATILTGSAFLPLKDDNIFKNCKVVDGAVTWMDEELTAHQNLCTKTVFDLSQFSNCLKQRIERIFQMNPAKIFQLKASWDRFAAAHPKFPLFLRAVSDGNVMQEALLPKLLLQQPTDANMKQI